MAFSAHFFTSAARPSPMLSKFLPARIARPKTLLRSMKLANSWMKAPSSVRILTCINTGTSTCCASKGTQRVPAGTHAHRGTAIKNPPQIFDSKRHITFQAPSKVLMMKDIGFADDVGVSPVAVTHPFQLFSPEAIKIMRSEIAKPEVRKEHLYSSNIAKAQLRGYARKHAPFTYAAWTHPETIAIVSRLADIELIPWGDYEIAHINLSTTKTEDEVKAELDGVVTHRTSIESAVDVSLDDNKPIVGWHNDSYPFVCVLMMSDCTGMVGGETALRTANGDVLRIRGPTEGCAVILQGRYITHQALRALGTKERITAVTSWRPRSPFVKDDSVLRTVRPVSDTKELYPDFTEYRLKIMEERLRHARGEIHARREAGGGFDTMWAKDFLQESAAFLTHTDRELVQEDKVSTGFIDTTDVPDVGVVICSTRRATAKRRD